MNNREIALTFWILIIIIIILFQKGSMKSMIGVVKAFFAWKLTLFYLLMATYISSIILLFYKIGFWNISLLKDTLIWVLFVGLTMLITSNKINKDSNYFKNVIFENLKIITIIEFITNIYVLNIFAELIIIPILLLLTILSVYSSYHEKYIRVKTFIDFILSIIGIFIISFAIFKIISNFQDFATLNNLRSFLITPILTLLYLPFMYGVALFMSYEVLFMRINVLHRNNNNFKKNIKIGIVKNCFVNLQKLNRFSCDMRIYEIEKFDDIMIEIKRLNKK